MDYDGITKYREIMDENIFSCMELTKQNYESIMVMPIKRFNDFLKWKLKLEEDKENLMKEELAKAQNK